MRNKQISILIALLVANFLSTFKPSTPVAGQRPNNGHPRSVKRAPRKQDPKGRRR